MYMYPVAIIFTTFVFPLSETGAVLLSNLPLVDVVRWSPALRRDAQVPQLPRGRSHHAGTHQVHEATGEFLLFTSASCS